MAYNIRYPMITGASEKDQLLQMQSYLHQLVEQLNYSLNNIDTVQIKYISSPAASTSSSTKDDKGTKATFEALKPLIIKSAEIVNALYDEVNTRLEGLYIARSEFGVFAEKTSQNISANSMDISQAFKNVQIVATEVSNISTEVETLDTSISDVDKSVQSVDDNLWQLDNKLKDAKEGIDTSLKTLSNDLGQLDSGIKDLKDNVESDLKDIQSAIDNIVYTLVEVNASIKSGLLYYDENEIPIYGLEIGQRNIIDGVEVFNKFARFTSDRLSFYDQNGIEVAYISDRKLYINNVEITISLKMGGLVSEVMSNGDIVEKWVGRG